MHPMKCRMSAVDQRGKNSLSQSNIVKDYFFLTKYRVIFIYKQSFIYYGA